MRIISSLPLISSLAMLVAGCAVETSPSTVDPSEPSAVETSPATHAAARPIEAGGARPDGLPFCFGDDLPIGPVSCDTFLNTMYATTPDNSYASTCAGQAIVQFAAPHCSNASPYYTWDVIPGGFPKLASVYSKLPPAQCAQVYVDVTLWTQSASTGVWKKVTSGRSYGQFEFGMCQVPYEPSQYLSTADLGAIQISADAYEPAYWGNLFLGMYAVPLTIRVTPPN